MPVTPVRVLNCALSGIRPAEDRHLDAAIVIFPFDPPVARREPIFKYRGWFGHAFLSCISSPAASAFCFRRRVDPGLWRSRWLGRLRPQLVEDRPHGANTIAEGVLGST